MFIKNLFFRIKNNNLVFSSYLSFVSWLIPSALALIIPVFLISSIGEAGYGTYALLISIAGYFTIADLSLDAFLIPKISNKNGENKALIQGTKALFISISLVVLISSLLLLAVFKENNILGLKDISGTTIIFFSFYSSSQLLLTVSYIIASGTQKLNSYNKRILITNLFYIILVFSLKYFELLSVESLIFSRLFANLIAIFDMIISKSIFSDFKSILIIFNKETFLFSKFSIIGKAISYASFNFDKIVLATFLTLYQVGIIAFPMQLGLALVMGASRFCLPLLPISGEHSNNKQSLSFDLTILYFVDIVLLLIGFCVSILIIWLPYIIPYIYSNKIDIRVVQTAFSLIIIGFWMISWSAIPANVLPGWGKMKLNVMSSSIRAVIIFIFMLIFIKKIGMLSIGLSILMGGIWEVLFLFWFLKKNNLKTSYKRLFNLSGFVFLILFSAVILNSFIIENKNIYSALLTFTFILFLLYNFKIFNFKKEKYEEV